MTEFSASVAGGRDMLLFCDKVVKDDIQVRTAFIPRMRIYDY